MRRRADVTLAALDDLYGGDGLALLEERDPFRREVRQALAVRRADMAEQRDRDLAIMVARGVNGQAI